MNRRKKSDRKTITEQGSSVFYDPQALPLLMVAYYKQAPEHAGSG